MAIVGVGVDLVEIAAIGAAVERSGQPFLDKIYTPVEQARCQGRRKSLPCYANRFAAKEALAKALQLGIGLMGLTNAEVRNRANGAPYFELHGPLRSWAARQPGLRIHLSLSDVEGHAIAMVTVEADVGVSLPVRLRSTDPGDA